MKKIILLVLLSLMLCSCQKDEVKETFDFSLSYAIAGRNLISSIDQKFIFDSVEGEIEKELKFTNDELQQIKEKLEELQILEADYAFLNRSFYNIQPNEHLSLKVIIDDTEFSLKWRSDNIPKHEIIRTIEDASQPNVAKLEMVARPGYEEALQSFNNLYYFRDFVMSLVEDKGLYDDLPEPVMYE